MKVVSRSSKEQEVFEDLLSSEDYESGTFAKDDEGAYYICSEEGLWICIAEGAGISADLGSSYDGICDGRIVNINDLALSTP